MRFLHFPIFTNSCSNHFNPFFFFLFLVLSYIYLASYMVRDRCDRHSGVILTFFRSSFPCLPRRDLPAHIPAYYINKTDHSGAPASLCPDTASAGLPSFQRHHFDDDIRLRTLRLVRRTAHLTAAAMKPAVTTTSITNASRNFPFNFPFDFPRSANTSSGVRIPSRFRDAFLQCIAAEFLMVVTATGCSAM